MIDEDFGAGGHTERDRRLLWMVLASATLHLSIVAILLLMPRGGIQIPVPMQSYTVDLVAPNRIGGTNMVAGGRGRSPAAPLVAALPQAAPQAAESLPESPPPPPAPVRASEEKVAAPPVAEKAPVKPPPAPKPEERPKEREVVLPDKAKKAEPVAAASAPKLKPSPRAAAKPEVPRVDAPKTDPKAAKAAREADETKRVADAKAATERKKAADEKAVEEAKKAAEAKAAKAAGEVKAAGEAKVAAEAKRVAEALAASQAAAVHARDERIAAAIRRIESQMGERGGGSGPNDGQPPGGPISIGPGEGPGGQPIGMEYLLYRNLLEAKIKQNWAWAGTTQALKTTVHFKITETGEVVEIRITESSGDASYDKSVERAVRGSSPLPPPPEAFREQFGDVEYVFTPQSLQM